MKAIPARHINDAKKIIGDLDRVSEEDDSDEFSIT